MKPDKGVRARAEWVPLQTIAEFEAKLKAKNNYCLRNGFAEEGA